MIIILALGRLRQDSKVKVIWAAQLDPVLNETEQNT
jgi:hypothetical protein